MCPAKLSLRSKVDVYSQVSRASVGTAREPDVKIRSEKFPSKKGKCEVVTAFPI